MSRPDLPMPLNLKGLNAEWIGNALSIRFPGVTVTDSRIIDVIPGTTTKVRVAVKYNQAGLDMGLPGRLIVKGGFEAHSEAMSSAYVAENRFYALVQQHVDLRSPSCYYADSDPDSWQSIIIMEDLVARGVTFCHPLQTHSFQQVADRLRAMARYHGQSWNSPEFQPGGVLGNIDIPFTDSVMDYIDFYLSAEQWNRLLALPRGAAVPRAFHDREWLREKLLALKKYHEGQPRSILHGDTHLGNLYIDADGTPGFFDPQVRQGPWHYEVCYHLIAALDVCDRRRWDRPLLEVYLNALQQQGISTPDFDQAWDALRREVVWGLFIFLINEPTFQTEAVNTAYAVRYAMAGLDWGIV
ncbi:phosphotransferase [Spongiibacter sp. KMU-166]|uniref:Phosphotransferase n=1 Tax=Spongiibacter thalassae TaxID=2721624 RepID=A0ABX1G9X6_9GAMM|nr:phosphotransferase [Spongiibacter thalassae]NKI15966.1 phosphotransferase [Spongiibacter thalassae]